MPPYRIEFLESAKEDLAYYRRFVQRLIFFRIREMLQGDPMGESSDRKILQPNRLAPCELRVGDYRVFYRVLEDDAVVEIVAVGHKVHNKLFIRGDEVHL